MVLKTSTASVSPERRAKLMRQASRASVAVALTLIVIKAAAWVASGSVALLGSLLDSCLDAVASGLILLAINHALSPADEEHRFGHGKAEAIAGLVQAAVISGSALFLFIESINHFIRPVAVTASEWGIAVIVISLVLTIVLVRYQLWVLKQTGSLAVSADSLHYTSDLIMNMGVIAALVASGVFGLTIVDPIVGVMIAAFIVKSAWSIARQSYDTLMDREMSPEERARIEAVVLGHPEVRGLHDLRTRTSGINSFIQFHLELDPAIRLDKAHIISDRVEAAIARVFPDADIIIHADPAGIETPHDVVDSGLGPTP